MRRLSFIPFLRLDKTNSSNNLHYLQILHLMLNFPIKKEMKYLFLCLFFIFGF